MMILEEIMVRNVITLTEQDTIQQAFEVMQINKIRHLPIIDNEHRLIGLVSNQDIRNAMPSIFRSTFHVEDLQKPLSTIMKTKIITAHPLDFIEEISVIFYDNKIGCMPIVQNDKLVGIITETDILRTFVKLTGAHQPGSQLQIRVPHTTGMLSDITTVLKEENIKLLSVLVYPDMKKEQYKIIVLRIETINPTFIVETLKEQGFDVIWPKSAGMLS